jgi:hypothetical protein
MNPLKSARSLSYSLPFLASAGTPLGTVLGHAELVLHVGVADAGAYDHVDHMELDDSNGGHR